MANDIEMEAKFWKALKSDMTVMLGLDGVDESHGRPMTAQLDDTKESGRGPIWFFTANDTELVKGMGASHRAVLNFASKGHDLFAAVHGTLRPDNDRATIDRLWNKFVAAWYEGGKDDPKLQLIRLDAERAQIWLNANSLFAGVKMLLGSDPKKDYEDKVANVRLD
ncbi:MAG: pyridoxamine 5'-phosphate oxidase family protein [Alphaproteobacteria bacterium]|nr:pyridoxamine 5'-phosphate oxidase family protein [Alphaproteobacteria bacterium]